MVPPVPMEGFTRDGAVVLRQVESDNTQLAQWLVRCACGAEFVKRGSDIRTSKYLRCRQCAFGSLGEALKRHGETDTPLHVTWQNMKRRCYETSYQGFSNYGGRGISVCEEWRNSYEAFAAYVRSTIGERPSKAHSIDRIDNDGHYEPGNIRWSTRSEQMKNRRPSSQWKGLPGRPRKNLPQPTIPNLLQTYVDALLGGP